MRAVLAGALTAALLSLPSTAALASPASSEEAPAEVGPQTEPTQDWDALQRAWDEVEAERSAIEAERAALQAQRRALQAGEQAETGFGRPVTVPPDAEVKEAVSFGSDVIVEGRVTGDAVSFGGDVRVQEGGFVGHSAVSFGGVVDVAPGGVVSGDRVAMAMPGVGMQLLPSTTSSQDADHNTGLGSLVVPPLGAQLWQKMQWRLVFLLSVAGAGVLVVGLFPGRVARVARDVEVRPLRAALLGLLFSLVVLLLSGLMAITFIGLPVSLLLLGGLAVSWLFGFVGLCQAVGDRLPLENNPHGRWLAFVVGVVLMSVIGSLSWLGMAVVVSASVIGVGAAVSTRLGSVMPSSSSATVTQPLL